MQQAGKSDDFHFICTGQRPRGGTNEPPLGTATTTMQQAGKSDDCRFTCTATATSVCYERH
ncbi:uncharacterized protein N7500_006870 [Penicillium coprophilum]|uniref:uncharacterized protein n=1 Tax=Penicillium coprophilum TaxID=36646 RepID=UPI0023842AA7|nr:uncharacterized protein N7500_006870 [Penicillium coprophilum]KAJ5165040.1 hypothetical protein N7500_006870 [Penicillium coprophilum]